MLYYHRVGTQQCEPIICHVCFHEISDPIIAEDILVHKDDEHPEWMWAAEVSELDGKYLTLYSSRDTSRVGLSIDALRHLKRFLEKPVVDHGPREE